MREAAGQGELILTSLPGPPEVEAVALGPDGILSAAQPGSVFADLSTNSPTVMRKIYTAFKAKGIHVLDSPGVGRCHRRQARDAAGDGGRRRRHLQRSERRPWRDG